MQQRGQAASTAAWGLILLLLSPACARLGFEKTDGGAPRDSFAADGATPADAPGGGDGPDLGADAADLALEDASLADAADLPAKDAPLPDGPMKPDAADLTPQDAPLPDKTVPDKAMPDLHPTPDAGCTPQCTTFSCGAPNGCGGACQNTCGAAKQVYYSVGQNTTDHKTGNPLITIASGVATFSVAQTHPRLGVGDRVTYSSTQHCYLKHKKNATTWAVTSAFGGAPSNVMGAAVTSIRHEFASLKSALAGAGDTNHLGTTNLVAANVTLNLPCYYDSGPDTTPAEVGGFTTDASHYIRIYTPFDPASECNVSQRHAGKWTSTAFSMQAPVTTEWFGVISLRNSHVRLAGLQVKETTTDNKLQGFSGIYLKAADAAPAGDVRISDCLVWNASTLATSSGRAIYGSTFSGAVYVWNNVLFNTGQSEIGIRLTDTPSTTLYFYNNTVVDYTKNGDQTETKLPRIFKNNLIIGSGIANYRTSYAAGSDCNYSDDTSDTSGAKDIKKGNIGWSAVTFIAKSLQDYHLASTDTGATNRGADLSADPKLPLVTDVDGQLRQGSWDIGADER